MKKINLLFIITCLAGCFSAEPQKTGKEGKPMPNFNLLLTDSTTKIHTRDIVSGKPIVFFYFSPYCPYCKKQTQTIVENIDNLKNIQFYFITSFPMQALKTFEKEYKLKMYSNITCSVDFEHSVGDYFEVPGFPYLAIYGKNKKLNKTFLGKIYSNQLIKVSQE